MLCQQLPALSLHILRMPPRLRCAALCRRFDFADACRRRLPRAIFTRYGAIFD